jgi:hypothetical protein
MADSESPGRIAKDNAAAKPLTADELDRLMRAQFGDDYRNKVIVGPLSVFPLAGVFDECGLEDPEQPPPVSQARGIFQFIGTSLGSPAARKRQ